MYTMENLNINHQLTTFNRENSDQKHCWVCFGTDDDEFEGSRDWVSPCKCRGSTRWVHQICVQRWVDEKLKENSSIEAHCPQCNTKYIIVFKDVNYFVQLLNKIDKTSNQLCPFLAAGVVVSTLYWSAASYGAITVMQVMGEEEAISMMENTDPYLLLLMLPAIPLTLVLGKTIDWEETLLLMIQRFTSNLPFLRTIMPSFLCEPINRVNSNNPVQFNPVISPTTTLCAALLLPTTSTLVGNILFDSSSYSNFQKTLLGGLVYIAVKGVLRIYQRQHNAIKDKTRKVIDYPDSESEDGHQLNIL
ncbi:E3 ubiquitin-protein ligase MARCHF5-like isoform X3 [Daktulosphaira vitifoliae]|uniref:E3 ubiquitin-protein ligase MARCHF5-like isoform X1 n=1 Tax=Daktulosphaira vitifoliae TaxID=58002 RepID=UPI0021AA86B7|nr:E3 ubiquitin-protein ligase MARCHF5-like isoform X1 [Daktulosphaira vitifoliae]XP_050532549.1 E3 ubiquitin-protein ligase MARCHF5-like isoform X2 [Daktulosphaira vitifoliae]XP_050532550.1 E3 ubiquitin-protein ligase MARCHF5-like isoform X3 [Daktulosphaira vitifoliae]